MKKMNKLHLLLFISGAAIIWLVDRMSADTLYLCLGIYLLGWNNAEDINLNP